MEVEIRVEAEFWIQAKRLSKKYHSMRKDLQEFKKSLIGNPYQGCSLGRGVRKVRMAIFMGYATYRFVFFQLLVSRF